MRSSGGLRIAMACARFPPLVGGTEVHVAQVGARLAARGHDVTVFTTVLDPSDQGVSIVDGMEVVRLRAWPPRSDLYFAPSMRRRIRHGTFDVVHVQGYHTFVAPIAMSAARAAGVPFVVTFHSGGHSSRIRRTIRPIQHAALRSQLGRASKLIAVSAFEAEQFRRRLGLDVEKFLTIANGVDDVFGSVDPSAVSRTVSSVGRLEEYKGHHHVIEAFAQVSKRVSGARLRIVGTGSFESHLRSLAEDLEIAESVEFTSVAYGDRAAMARVMAGSHVVALASSYESQGIVGHEALATGASLVVFGGSALADLGSFPSVDVVPPGSTDALACAIESRLIAPRSRDRPRFPSWDDVAERIEGLYLEVLGSNGK